ncbi:acetyl-CoA carboxylase biotin carboxyl carrier protein subunit [Bradyrhizobium sp. BWA-3-5]|uniref:acetyl-CoA carboxylase biotin carboxyl carrier protein subunit n=1 Tax=Bradyrhizobium sp. BWA-3-5 TaxID=3080013 RepID=UPI00293E368D|nr:biotin/lipoyl-containing protein [Bradyrhizobium sp. BWA-3-5]WOH63820.1 biotin/lipoyl-containing protein [Bradyrhizobium sp. BWA-3-5]
MYHSFEVDGVDFQLWLSPCEQGYRLHLHDKVIAPIAFTHHADGCGVLTIAGDCEPVRYAIDGEMLHVYIRGSTHILRYCDPLRTLASTNHEAGQLAARAPMPGVVVTTKVSPGQTVSAGLALMTIESMKLETIIRSPRDGVVQLIHFKEGDSFERDAVLVTLCEEGC